MALPAGASFLVPRGFFPPEAPDRPAREHRADELPRRCEPDRFFGHGFPGHGFPPAMDGMPPCFGMFPGAGMMTPDGFPLPGPPFPPPFGCPMPVPWFPGQAPMMGPMGPFMPPPFGYPMGFPMGHPGMLPGMVQPIVVEQPQEVPAADGGPQRVASGAVEEQPAPSATEPTAVQLEPIASSGQPVLVEPIAGSAEPSQYVEVDVAEPRRVTYAEMMEEFQKRVYHPVGRPAAAVGAWPARYLGTVGADDVERHSYSVPSVPVRVASPSPAQPIRRVRLQPFESSLSMHDPIPQEPMPLRYASGEDRPYRTGKARYPGQPPPPPAAELEPDVRPVRVSLGSFGSQQAGDSFGLSEIARLTPPMPSGINVMPAHLGQ